MVEHFNPAGAEARRGAAEQGAQCLDVGCGEGRFCRMLAKQG